MNNRLTHACRSHPTTSINRRTFKMTSIDNYYINLVLRCHKENQQMSDYPKETWNHQQLSCNVNISMLMQLLKNPQDLSAIIMTNLGIIDFWTTSRNIPMSTNHLSGFIYCYSIPRISKLETQVIVAKLLQLEQCVMVIQCNPYPQWCSYTCNTTNYG